MKIAFLSSYAHLVLERSASRVSGGAELQVALLARELAQRGIEPVIVSGDTGQRDGLVCEGVRIRTAGAFHSGNPLHMALSAPRLLAVLAEERPDWIFVLGWTAWMALVVAAGRILGFRTGFICGLDSELTGDFRRENPWRGGLFEWGVANCNRRFAMTQTQERLFEQREWPCAMYRNLILPRAFPRSETKEVDFLWVSRCQPIKRPHHFLDLAGSLPEHTFEMICPREDAELWERTARRAATLPNLRFIEKVPYHEIQRHYDRARIFVNTSEWEGWPNSFIQSGLGHTALLSLAVNPDNLFERFNPGVFANGQAAGLPPLAREMLADSASLSRMQEGCARFVRELHDNSRETDAFLAGLG